MREFPSFSSKIWLPQEAVAGLEEYIMVMSFLKRGSQACPATRNIIFLPAIDANSAANTMTERDVEIRRDDPTAPYVAELLAHHLQELNSIMAEYAFALDATGLSDAAVTFWTAWQGDGLVGFAALKQLDDRHGEVKSMRAAPAARGTGVGRALLQHVIAEARQRGYARLSLETGTAALHAPAIALYRSTGFVSCEAFADYPESPHNQFMRLDLAE